VGGISAAQLPVAHGRRAAASELGQAFAAARTRLGLVGLLLLFAGLAWWSTGERMAGMDTAPGADLGTLGWFAGVWVVMMAAMMFPSLSPTVALYARMTRRRGPVAPLLFSSAYLFVWGLAGVLAYGAYEWGRSLFGTDLRWDAGGRWFAGAVLLTAALYELTPLKDVCLQRCRTPVGFLLGAWRDGRRGALAMGTRNAAWCVGCCWALMGALFALGVMSVTWMAFVAALIALEKMLPWPRVATWGTAAVLVLLAVTLLAAPHSVPAFVVPGGGHNAHGMNAMH
jgi:predicted metal-binding membrane protein